jgi:PREDICTED: GTPase activating rap/ranGAP domain-like 1
MALPIHVLKSDTVLNSDQSVLLRVLRTLIQISSPSPCSSPVPPTASAPVPPKRRSTINEVEVESNLAASNDETLKSDSTNAAKKSLAKGDTNSNSCNNDLSVIQLAAKMLLQHLIYYLGHFPLPILGAARVSSFISEVDDNTFLKNNDDELTSEVLNAPNVLFFIINNSSIVSIVDLGHGSSSDNLTNGQPLVRTIVRDLIGKFSWDSALISSLFNLKSDQASNYRCDSSQISFKSSNMAVESEDKDDLGEQADPLGLVLKDIGKNILNSKNGNFNAPALTCNDHLDQLEENMIALLSNQHYQEMNFIERPIFLKRPNNVGKNFSCTDQSQEKKNNDNNAYNCFMNGRQFIDQLGYFLWEKRVSIELLNKNERLLRELRNLDNQKCRETHKIAVIYVADGQEDKNSILMNKAGSEAFEKFVAGLGWEVNLENHLGFRGGLQQNKSTGETTPYYSTSFYEVIFHVSTRIPAKSGDSDSIRRKLTHLGNDEVHIVWSEHSRDYRRGIIPTEFCDVLIVIYPLLHYPGYYRIFISRKPEVPFFGPLYSGAFVHHNLLAYLVRETAINASRACRLQVPCYQNYFEERAKSIETIIKYHRESKCFEDFASSIYSPQLTAPLSSQSSQLPMRQISNLSQSGISVTSISSVSSSSNLNQSEGQNHSPSLQGASPKSRFRPASLSAIEFRPSMAK